jgi:hypothetical protein
MKNVTKLFLVGAVTVAAIYLFRFQEQVSRNVVGKARSKDPEQIVIAAALTVGLGLVAVVAAQALRKL